MKNAVVPAENAMNATRGSESEMAIQGRSVDAVITEASVLKIPSLTPQMMKVMTESEMLQGYWRARRRGPRSTKRL